jgi:hypothetical protein
VEVLLEEVARFDKKVKQLNREPAKQ